MYTAIMLAYGRCIIIRHMADEGGVNTFPVFSAFIDVGTCCFQSFVYMQFATWLEYVDSLRISTLCGK